ncbi:MAG: 2Fe-2S iron-sulfur cluster-binding protein [Clostridiales bacterium]|nr:2Fe-2S iron-sulfur cluster-binding protein [Clostridiales bacterium]
MSKESITLKVFRYDPERDEAPGYKDYEVPWSEGLLVLSALKYVRENIDETLAFRDFCCGCSWCMSCLMMVNGKGTRTCSWLLKPGESLLIEPMWGNPVIKDLVVDFGVNITTPQGTFKKMEGTVIRKV